MCHKCMMQKSSDSDSVDSQEMENEIQSGKITAYILESTKLFLLCRLQED